MREVTEWWSEIHGERGTWLLLGKGPTLERLADFDRGRADSDPGPGGFDRGSFRTLSLNHVVRDVPVEVAHVIDIDVVADCAESIDRNARFLLMPRHPHVETNASERRLEDFFAELPVLQKLDREGRLVWYDFATGTPHPPSPRVPEGYFSGEVAVSLLGILGARRIRTLGMDGGSAYSASFRDVEARTKFANRHGSFDLQWDGIAAAVRRHGIDFAPLTTEVPIRVFVGTDASQELGARVLEYSIRKHCPVPVVFDTMDAVRAPMPRDKANQPRTGFSFHRFAIPRLVGGKGRALYLDADMLVLRNLLELWDVPFQDATILYALSPNPAWPKQLSVLKLRCDELDWDVEKIVRGLDEGLYDYDGLMKDLCIEPPERIQPYIPPEWNSLEKYEPGRTCLIHYTRMSKQPWVSCRNPNGDLWVDTLREAIDAGDIALEEVERAVADEFARPSLPAQLRTPRRLWPLFRWTRAAWLDRGFRAHRALKERLAGADSRAASA